MRLGWLFVVALTHAAIGQSLVKNGSFEEPNIGASPYAVYFPSGASIPSWSFMSSGLGEASYLENFAAAGSPYKPVPGVSGAQALRVSFGDIISQVITNMAPGYKHRLVFSLELHGVTDSFLRVTIAGVTNDYFVTSGMVAMTFIPTNSTSVLTFSAVSAAFDDDVRGVTLDSIEMFPILAAPPKLAIKAFPDNQVAIALSGTPGAKYRIEYSSSISEPNWLPLIDIGLQGDSAVILDFTPNSSRRFYRAFNID